MSQASLAMAPIRQVGCVVTLCRFQSLGNVIINPLTEEFAIASASKYLVVKVSTSLRNFPTASRRELRIYEHLAKIKSSHPGQSLIRELYDAFELDGPAGKHQCLVQQPMHLTVLEMMRLNPKPFNLPLLKLTLRRILRALDFLHTEAKVIHTGMSLHVLMTCDFN